MQAGPGGVAEWFNAPVLKTGVRKDSWVRIPPPPLHMGLGSHLYLSGTKAGGGVTIQLTGIPWMQSDNEVRFTE